MFFQPFIISFRKLVDNCLCGTSEECNPKRLLKLIMICSHPDATLDILTDVGLVNTGFVESTESETKDTATDLEKTESEKSESKDNTATKEGTEVSKSGESQPIADSQDKGVEEGPAGMEQEDRAEGPWGLSGAGIDAYFKMCFLVVLAKYKVAGCIDEESYQELITWVEQDGFLNDKEKEYLDIVNALEEAL